MTFSSFSFFSLPDNCFYNSHYNFFLAPQLNGLSIYVYIYIFIACVVCLSFVLGRLRGISIDLARYLLVICWLSCLGVIGLQTSHQIWYLNTAQRNIGHMSDDQRYSFLFEYSYEIARAFKARVPAGSPALLLSDLPQNHVNVAVLPYFMFPQLDIVHHDRRPQYIVFFLTKNTVVPVPGHFRPIVVDVHNPTALMERVDDGR